MSTYNLNKRKSRKGGRATKDAKDWLRAHHRQAKMNPHTALNTP